MKNAKFFTTILISLGCYYATAQNKVIPVTDPPPQTWKEHWFDHVQEVKLQYKDKSFALYYDDDMDKNISWPIRFLKPAWDYTMKNYGPFGKSPYLYVIMHANKYSGGHPSTYFDESHDNRNVIDIGQNGSWADSTNWNLDATVHEIGHIVEGASNNTHGSPAFAIWRDSKWIEIYQYDIYKKLGWTKDQDRWYQEKMKTEDNFPQKGTKWFKNWFYPIYTQYGETKVLVSFFKLLSENFPSYAIGKDLNEFDRDLNFGEFVFFWSGAAGKDLKELAIKAFGTKDAGGNDWLPQFEQAKKDFPKVKFKS